MFPVDFKHQLNLVQSLVQDMDIGPDKTRVGLGVYSENFQNHIPLDNNYDKVTLLREIAKAPNHRGELTHIFKPANFLPTSVRRSTPSQQRGLTNVLGLHVPLFRKNIETFGFCNVSLHINGHLYQVGLIVVDVRHPLLGANVLHVHNLLVDLLRRCLTGADFLCPDRVQSIQILAMID
ncbi:hypothetical protein PoB_007489400 [Plakobranchus ocellatus]|uniref:VWFA domain-containing protein n=1 Tax=Plakobranchus ocellatus TaxID=259542 RepID=A0AAV4DWE4_9GAST|nr:hypothetical protein PoB_007489400 [Plakobranchus ocellatus]